MMPLVEAMSVRPHLRALLLNHALLAAHKAGDPVTIRRGTKVVEASESRIMAERAVLEAGELHRPEKVTKALEHMEALRRSKKEGREYARGDAKGKKRRSVGTAAHIRESLAAILRILDEKEPSCHAKSGNWVAPATEQNRNKNPPEWAGKVKYNLLGRIPFTRCHFFAAVKIGEAMIEALMDTGGARSVVDKHTAAKMGLQVASGDYGSFWGLGAGPVPYLGCVLGPIRL